MALVFRQLPKSLCESKSNSPWVPYSNEYFRRTRTGYQHYCKAKSIPASLLSDTSPTPVVVRIIKYSRLNILPNVIAIVRKFKEDSAFLLPSSDLIYHRHLDVALFGLPSMNS